MKLILYLTIPTEYAHLFVNSNIPCIMIDYFDGTTDVNVTTDAITIPVQLIKESHATGYAVESFLGENDSIRIQFCTDGIFTDSDSFQISIDQFAHATCEDGVITVTLQNGGTLVSDIHTDDPIFDLEWNDEDDLELPDELLLENDHFDPVTTILLYITILGQKFALVKVEELTKTWFATIPVTEFTSDSIPAVLYYRHCGDSTPGEALRNRKLDTLYNRYKAIEENADAAFHRAFNEVYTF